MRKVSVIVAVYNSALYLRQCLDSILGQTYLDYELICVDDGSRDGSERILDEYESKDDRICIIHREKCSGSAAVPRNIALDIAKGEYVIILDSDDWFDCTMIEKLVSAAVNNDADLVMCDNYLIGEDLSVIQSEGEIHHSYLPDRIVFNVQEIPEKIFQISNATTWHKLIRRDIIEKHKLRFQEQTPVLDDIYFVNMVDVLANKITIVDEKLVYYRFERPDAQTSRINSSPDSIHKAFCALYDGLESNGFFPRVAASFRVWAINTYAWWLSSVTDYRVYSYLIEKYRNDWLRDLGLFVVEQDYHMLKPDLVMFLRMILDDRCIQSRKELVESLKKHSRIVLYGAGRYGKKAKDFINSYGKHEIVAWCDKNAEIMKKRGICTISEINKKEFDALIIAIYDGNTSLKAKEELIKAGIDERDIYIFR